MMSNQSFARIGEKVGRGLSSNQTMGTEAGRIAAMIPEHAWKGKLTISEGDALKYITPQQWQILKAEQDADFKATIHPQLAATNSQLPNT